MNFQTDKEYGLWVMDKFNKISKEYSLLLGKFMRKTNIHQWDLYKCGSNLKWAIEDFKDLFGETPAHWETLTEDEWQDWYEEILYINERLDDILLHSYWGKLVAKKIVLK
jgi:hypothetical protein